MDNFYHNCPPKAQGRDLTDYQTATRRNEYIKYVNNIHRDDQYRLFLQTNGTEILDNMWNFQRANNSCPIYPCIHHYGTRTNTRQMVQEREAYDSIFNMNTHDRLAPMRQCVIFEDYRLNPPDPQNILRPMPDVLSPRKGPFSMPDRDLDSFYRMTPMLGPSSEDMLGQMNEPSSEHMPEQAPMRRPINRPALY